jgi:signal peptidase II
MNSYRLIFWILALWGLALDQSSKYCIFSHLYNQGRGDEIEVLPNAFHIVARFTPEVVEGDGLLARLRTLGGCQHMPWVNHGALFGIGGRDENGRDLNLVFAVISVAAAIGISICSTRPGVAQDKLLCIALGLILAGTLGNLFDRVVFHGVRDFLWWHKVVNWPVFNIADCCLVCGASTLLLQAFLLPEPLSHPVALPQETSAVTSE